MNINLAKRILVPAGIIAILTGIVWACAEDPNMERSTPPPSNNFSINLDTKAPGDIVSDMRLFTFYKDGAKDRKFSRELLNITRNNNTLSTAVEIGNWYLSMVSVPAGTTLTSPTMTGPMESLPMFQYAPITDVVTGKSSSAPEIVFAHLTLPTIVANQPTTASAQLTRNVALVELIVTKATPNFDLTSMEHRIELHDVPSTISYTGALLPSKTAPYKLATPLVSRLRLKDSPNAAGYLCADTVRFVIPAHVEYDNQGVISPNDTTTLKMSVSLDLVRLGGGVHFLKTKEIPLVAKANQVLRVNISVNDGVEFSTECLPWERTDINTTVGEQYSNWLYVKEGATGSGQSWRDPMPSIGTAIAKAGLLQAAMVPVHGILVAGGDSREYNESFTLPDNIKVFGGWEGTPGTELPTADASAPYTSNNRKLADYKAKIALGGGNIVLSGNNAVLDGFIVQGAAPGNNNVISISNTTASINAVEIKGNTIGSGFVLVVNGGTATNVLVRDNSQGISVTGGGKLVNATIVNNKGASNSTNGTLQNCVIWGNTPASYFTFSGSNTIQYCAFEGTNDNLPDGTGNVPLNANNNTWFTANEIVPGPHFNMTSNSARPYYMALNNRSPMIGRGNLAAFSNNTYIENSQDINGNNRTRTINLETWIDIGCYQDFTFKGFELRWNMTNLYIAGKANRISDHPMILFDNTENAMLKWTATITQLDVSNAFSISGSNIGSGPVDVSTPDTRKIVGMLNLLSGNVANSTTAAVKRGKINFSTNLKAYMPDQEVEVWQTSSQSAVWSSGYVGSFHRANETKERYISGANTIAVYSGGVVNYQPGGRWTVRIVSGMDWIKIDRNPKGSFGGEVQEVFGGVIESIGTENIGFRVGMKSVLPPERNGKPRYGLILIERGGSTGGMALFFVRQGEEPDYVYDGNDPHSLYPGRPLAKKVSPFNITDPGKNRAMSGTNIGAGGNTDKFTDYPTKIGYYFQWNRTNAYPLPEGTESVTFQSGAASSWIATNDVCPQGYRHWSDGELNQSVYLNKNVSDSGRDVTANYAWGRYADGYFDQYAPDPVSHTTTKVSNGVIAEMAAYGIIMYNDYNNAHVFFPTGGRIYSTNRIDQDEYGMYWTSTNGRNTHWAGMISGYPNGHVGISCTTLGNGNGGLVRCVKDE